MIDARSEANTLYTETFGANLALGTLLAELSQHRPTQNFITAHQRVFSYIIAPALLLIGGYIGSYPQEHEDYKPWSAGLHHFLIDPAGDGSRGSLIVPKGTDAQRRTSAFMIQCAAFALFMSPQLQRLLSHRFLLWLGKHSFAVYLVHGSILRTVGMWIAYGISGEPFTPATKNEDGSKKADPIWVRPKSDAHKVVSIIIFTGLTYLAAWAWMKWVDSACARFTQWLEDRVFDDDEEDNKNSLAEKGYANGNGHSAPLLRPENGERREPPP